MKRSGKFTIGITIGIITSLGLGLAIAAAQAHPGGMAEGMGPGMMGGMGPGMMRRMGREPGVGSRGAMRGPMAGSMQNDAAASVDMGLVHDLLLGHDRIKRTVSNLPNGIKTVTESGDPNLAQSIKAHVASMAARLTDGREFNMFSKTIPVLFENKDKIKTTVEITPTGAVVTQISNDSTVVAALQAHAAEVSELARDGMAAMMRSAQANMGMMQRGPRANSAANNGPGAGMHTH